MESTTLNLHHDTILLLMASPSYLSQSPTPRACVFGNQKNLHVKSHARKINYTRQICLINKLNLDSWLELNSSTPPIKSLIQGTPRYLFLIKRTKFIDY